MLKREDIVARVHRVVLDEFDVEEEDLHADAFFGEDLDLDSLDGIDLVVALEREFRDIAVSIKEDQARSMKQLRDVYEFIESAAAGRASAPAPGGSASKA